jgi:hypothetical protein
MANKMAIAYRAATAIADLGGDEKQRCAVNE